MDLANIINNTIELTCGDDMQRDREEETKWAVLITEAFCKNDPQKVCDYLIHQVMQLYRDTDEPEILDGCKDLMIDVVSYLMNKGGIDNVY